MHNHSIKQDNIISQLAQNIEIIIGKKDSNLSSKKILENIQKTAASFVKSNTATAQYIDKLLYGYQETALLQPEANNVLGHEFLNALNNEPEKLDHPSKIKYLLAIYEMEKNYEIEKGYETNKDKENTFSWSHWSLKWSHWSLKRNINKTADRLWGLCLEEKNIEQLNQGITFLHDTVSHIPFNVDDNAIKLHASNLNIFLCEVSNQNKPERLKGFIGEKPLITHQKTMQEWYKTSHDIYRQKKDKHKNAEIMTNITSQSLSLIADLTI